MMLLLWSFAASSQVVKHDFDDGMGIDQTWYGDTASFNVMNGSLWSGHQIANAAFSVYTELPPVEVCEWLFACHLHFNTSSVNYADYGLFTDSAFTDGLVIRIGGTSDNVSFYQVENDQYRLVHYGEEKITVDRRVEVALTGTDSLLFAQFKAEGYSETFAVDSTGIQPAELKWFRIKINQSTSGFFGKHELEYVRYGEPEYDTTAPELMELTIASGSQMWLDFSESLHEKELPLVRLEKPTGWGSVEDMTLNEETRLVLTPELVNGKTHRLIIKNLCDVSGNCTDTILDFIPLWHQDAGFGEVVVTEIMAKPEPVVGLPPFEYIELHNRSDKIIDLAQLVLSSNGQPVNLPVYFLLPDSFATLTGSGEWPMAGHPNVLVADGLFAINNSQDEIQLHDLQGNLIHEVRFTSAFITDKAKAQGGWSVEMGDVDRFCTMEGNWKASFSPQGGTPGEVNSWQIRIEDEDPPVLRTVGLDESSMVSLHFNEGLHPVSDIRLVYPDGSTEITDWIFDYNSVTASMNVIPEPEPMPYLITGMSDCYGNVSADIDTIFLGSPKQVRQGELIINEIMFHADVASEYIEFKNVSGHVIDLHGLNLRTRSPGSEWSAAYPLVASSHLLLSGQLICFTKDVNRVIVHFRAEANPENIFPMTDLPALNDNESELAVVDRSLNWIDTIHYSEDMHYALLADVEDVSLERLIAGEQQWMSASSASGYGTPGGPNSHGSATTAADHESTGFIDVSCDPVTPDNDGWNDRVAIGISHPGMFNYSVSIWRTDGGAVNTLVEQGYGTDRAVHSWDGRGADGHFLTEGIYLVLVELRTEGGQTRRITKCITVHY